MIFQFPVTLFNPVTSLSLNQMQFVYHSLLESLKIQQRCIVYGDILINYKKKE